MDLLPPELIFRILELGVGKYDIRRTCVPEREYLHLRNMALVCRAWVPPSQMLLLRYVVLKDLSHVQRWIDNPPTGRYRTRELCIRSSGRLGELGRRVLPRVLSHIVGLQTLHLVFFEFWSIPSSFLALPALNDLTALVVSNCSISNEEGSDFAFSLRFFQMMHSKIHPAVIRELFRKSAKTLQTLELERQHAMDSSTLLGLCQSFPLVAGTVRTLRIGDAYSSLVPCLASCIALKQLELTQEVDAELATAIFKVLPAPLEDLYLEGDVWDDSSKVFFVLEAVGRGFEYPSLSHLKRLHVKQDVIDKIGEAFPATLRAHSLTVIAVCRDYW